MIATCHGMAWTTTSRPSMTAIQNAARSLRSRSQRPVRVVWCSTTARCSSTGTTLPSGRGEPGPPAGSERLARGLGPFAAGEEPIHRRSGAADVGTEGAELAQLLGERRRREVVRRQGGEVGGSPCLRQRLTERVATLLESWSAVEGLVDSCGRFLLRAAREHEQDPVVLRQGERRELAAVAETELRARREEERDVGAEAGGERVQPLGRKRRGQRLVRQLQRGRGIGAAAA